MKLSRLEKKMIEEYWRNIDDYRKKQKFRYWELTEAREVDENIGGGRSSNISDPTARKALIISEDMQYQHLKRIVEGVERTYEELDEDMKKIVHMRYWNDVEVMQWEDIACLTGRSNRTIYRLRDVLIKKTASKIGWI